MLRATGSNRGEGYQPLLGDGILKSPPGPSVALLKDGNAPWPTKALKDAGYQFHGYHLDGKQRPTFVYSIGEAHIEDFMLPVEGKDGSYFRRTLLITNEKNSAGPWYRAAAGAQIKVSGDGWYTVGNDLKIRLEAPEAPVLRTSNGMLELLVPIRGKQFRIVQDYVW